MIEKPPSVGRLAPKVRTGLLFVLYVPASCSGHYNSRNLAFPFEGRNVPTAVPKGEGKEILRRNAMAGIIISKV